MRATFPFIPISEAFLEKVVHCPSLAPVMSQECNVDSDPTNDQKSFMCVSSPLFNLKVIDTSSVSETSKLVLKRRTLDTFVAPLMCRAEPAYQASS